MMRQLIHAKNFILGLLMLTCMPEVTAQDLPSISARDLIGVPSIRAVAMSPAADLIIYELRTTDFEQNRYHKHLWQIQSDGTGQRQVTYSAGDEWDPRISPDGHCLAFLSDRPDQPEKTGTRIWAMPLTGGEAKPLTDPQRDILDFKWSQDASYLYYMCTELKPKSIQTWEKDREKTGFDAEDRNAEYPRIEIWRVAKSTAKHERLFVGDPGLTAFDVDPGGTRLVYSTNFTGDPNDWIRSDIFLFSIPDSSSPVQLTHAPGVEENPRFSADGYRIAYQTVQEHKKPFSQTEIEVLTLSDSKISRLTQSLDRGVAAFQWYNNNTLLLEVQEGLENQLYLADLQGDLTAISGGAAYIYQAAVNQTTGAVSAVRQTAGSLAELIYTRGPGHPWKRLSNYSELLDQRNINPQTVFRWISRDQRFKLEGLVVLPYFSGNEPLPLIVDIHGGPAGRTDLALEQFALYQAWASQGFAVFSPNYRGSEGYTAAFQVANYRDLGGADYQDIMAGVKSLIKRGIAHPDSLVIMGGSYGGYMTNWIITQTNMFKVAVSRYGIFDLKTDFSNSIYAQWELDYLGKPYWDDPAAYRRMSPAAYIKNAKTPTLILHGAEDENTFNANSRELARALKTLDVPHHFFLYPREAHGMDEPSHRLDVFDRQLSWVNHHLARKSPLQGSDWLGTALRVQILSADTKASFTNRGETRYLRIQLLLDGSRLTRPRTLRIQDFMLKPGDHGVTGLPSGSFLLPAQNLSFELGPREPTQKLELVFPLLDLPEQTLWIRNVGSFSIPR